MVLTLSFGLSTTDIFRQMLKAACEARRVKPRLSFGCKHWPEIFRSLPPYTVKPGSVCIASSQDRPRRISKDYPNAMPHFISMTKVSSKDVKELLGDRGTQVCGRQKGRGHVYKSWQLMTL